MGRRIPISLILLTSLVTQIGAQAETLVRPNTGAHTSTVMALGFSGPEEVVTVGLDKIAYRWNLESGESVPIRFAVGRQVEGMAVDVAADRGNLALGLLSNVDSKLPTLLASGGSDALAAPIAPGVGKVAWSPSGSVIACITFGEKVVAVDTKGKTLWTFAIPEPVGPGRRDPRAGAIRYSADGKQVLVTYYKTNSKALWRFRLDAASGKMVGARDEIAGNPIRSALDGAGNVAWADADGTLKYWGAGSKTAKSVGPKAAFARAVAFSPDGGALAVSLDGVAGKPGRVAICDVKSARVVADVETGTSVDALGFSVDGRRIACAVFPADLAVLDASNGRTLKKFSKSGALPVRMGWSPDGNALLWTTEFAFAQAAGISIRPSSSFDFSSRAISSSPSGKLIAESSANADLSLKWDAALGRVRATFPGVSGDAVTDKIPTNDPPRLVALSANKFAVIFRRTGMEAWIYSVAKARDSVIPIAMIPIPASDITSVSLHPNRPLLAVGSLDQQIRLFLLPEAGGPGSQVPTLSRSDLTLITSRTGDWVVFNEDLGYYDSSPGGDRLIGFQRQNGGNVDFVPVSSLASQFRKPGLIQEMFAGTRPSASDLPSAPAVAQADKVGGLDVIDVRGTTIVRGAMSNTDVPMWRTDKGEVEIVVDVSDAINKNDIQVANGTGGKSAGDGLLVEVIEDDRFVVRTKLYPGQNKIRVWANTRNGKTAEDLIEVERTGGTPKNDWNVFVLAVPEFNKLPALPAVQQDGQQVADFFRAQNGKGGQVNVKQVPTQKTSTKEIIQQLDEFTNSVKEGDSVLMYISSHGLPDEQGRYFIASKDIDTQNALGTGIDWSQVQDRLTKMNRQGARYVVLIVDSCFAGQAIAGRALNPQANEPAMSTMRALQGNTVLVTSSMPGQKSWTLMPEFLPKSMSGTKLPAQGMSLFTHALLRGLKGELGAQDAKGRIKLSTLFAFVSQEVATVVKKYQEAAEGGEKADFRQVRQDPWRSPFDDDIVIAQVPAR